MLQFDLANEIAREDRNAAKGDGEENAREHAQSRVCLGQAESTEGNSFDDRDNRKTLPSETVEVSIAVSSDLLDALRICDLAKDGVVGHLVGVRVVVLGVFLGLLGTSVGDCVGHDGEERWRTMNSGKRGKGVPKG